MRTAAPKTAIAILVVLATLCVRAPGFAGWFASEEDGEDRQTELYDTGREALDESEWERALEAFDELARMGGSKADGALYWKAYALGKLSRYPEAFGSIDSLTTTYPKSRWVDDAKALAMELKQKRGKKVAPEEEDPEELKLMALNGLIHMDPEQAIPMLERLLAGNASTRMKEQALFVLVQTGSPRARAVVEKTARGQSNPGLQRKAVELLGVFGGGESSRVLKEIYLSAKDEQVKRQVLQSYMVSGDTEALLAAARSEPDERLRGEAIQLLGAQGADEELAQLYETERSPNLKERILQAMAISGSPRLIEAARSEKDPRLRVAAVRNLGIMDHDVAGPALQEIYATDRSIEVRKAVLEAMMIQGNARAIVAIARKEKDPVLRRAAVEKLSVMGSKEATAYLMELLEE